jgi:hypothetical protein
LIETGSAGASVGACEAASVGATDALSVVAGVTDVLGAAAEQPANIAASTITDTIIKLTFFIVSSCINSKFYGYSIEKQCKSCINSMLSLCKINYYSKHFTISLLAININ